MCDLTAYNTHKGDPTRTIVLRNSFAAQMNKRFKNLRGAIKNAIVDNDILGLKLSVNVESSQDKIETFISWLNQQTHEGILETGMQGFMTSGNWTDAYINESYKRGVYRSRIEMQKAGVPVPPIEATGGIQASMSIPFHADRVGLMYARTFNELKGITNVMNSQISRVLAQSIGQGDGPLLIARKLNSVIWKIGDDLGVTDTLGRFIPAQRRAQMLARTEVIRAHHQAMINEYEMFAVEGVRVQAEWSTAGDDRVCAECESLERGAEADLENGLYSLEHIRGLIPRHTNCRCIALPYYKN